jgi:hypothetical protein
MDLKSTTSTPVTTPSSGDVWKATDVPSRRSVWGPTADAATNAASCGLLEGHMGVLKWSRSNGCPWR